MRDYGNDVALILNTAKKEVVNLANEAYKTGYNDCNSNRYIQGYEEAKNGNPKLLCMTNPITVSKRTVNDFFIPLISRIAERMRIARSSSSVSSLE